MSFAMITFPPGGGSNFLREIEIVSGLVVGSWPFPRNRFSAASGSVKYAKLRRPDLFFVLLLFANT